MNRSQSDRDVSGIYCLHLLDLLAEEGVDRERVLAGTGLSGDALAGPGDRIRFDQQLRIYANALALSRRPGLGYRLGRRERISDHGVFGYAIQSSTDLAQALRVLTRYQETVGPLLRFDMRHEEGQVVLVLDEVQPLGPLARMAREEMLVVIVLGLLSMSEPSTRPDEVRFDLPAEESDLDRSEIGCPVSYESLQMEVRFPRAALERGLAFSDEETARICENRCAELLERLGSPSEIVERVRRALVAASGSSPSLDRIARDLGMSGRSLRRRLKEEGASYRQVRESVLRSLALDYLQGSNLTIDEIASLLGYSETPNFYRAFQRWTGELPSAYRPSSGSDGRRLATKSA